ncbi:hypothetical protein, partial [Bradyrhizobium diazoefficiens]
MTEQRHDGLANGCKMLVLAQPYQEVLTIPERRAWRVQTRRNLRSHGHAYAGGVPTPAATCPKKSVGIVFARSCRFKPGIDSSMHRRGQANADVARLTPRARL